MDLMLILRNLAIILVAAKLCGLLARKLKAPQVVGEIIAGLIIGPSLLNLVVKDDFISGMAEIGVILLMFSAGLGTDLKELVKTGPVALLIALSGVAVPLVGGMLVYMGFGFGTPDTRLYEGIFMGTVLAATSVSITVQALKEMGHLKGKVGTTILSAAILDDIIGIILLTVVIGFKSPDVSPVDVCIKTILFFVLAIVLGFALYFLFKWISKHWPHSRRIPIFGLVLCFAAAYCSEEFFGIADITGAYVAGLAISVSPKIEYISKRVETVSYMFLSPIFFASIGLEVVLPKMTGKIIVFSVLLCIVAVLSKVIGCGLGAKLMRYTSKESLQIGVGMISRGEVALIVASKGMAVGLMSQDLYGPVIITVVITTIVTPILLKVVFNEKKDSVPQKAA